MHGKIHSHQFSSTHLKFSLSLQSVPGIDFTFKLIELYQKVKQAKQEFEIIYVSFDKSVEEWQQYCAQMPWISLPYGDSRIESLQRSFNVTGKEILMYVDIMDCKLFDIQ